MLERQLTEEQLSEIYSWVDQCPLSRPKRNMGRDFSDAVMLAQLIYHFNSKLVQVHNYPSTGSLVQKVRNWTILNDKVLKKLKVGLDKLEIEALAKGQPLLAEKLLFLVKEQITKDPAFSTNTSRMTVISAKEQPKTFKEIKKMKEVGEFFNAQDKSIDILKEQIQLLMTKEHMLQDIIKCKDREIDALIRKIKAQKVI